MFSLMTSLTELVQQRAHKALTAKEIVDKSEKAERPMDADEIQIFDRLSEEIGKLDEEIAATEASQRRRESLTAMIDRLEAPRRQTAAEPPANGPGTAVVSNAFRIPAASRPTSILNAFKPRQGESRDAAEMRAYRSGMWLRSSIFNDDRATNWCINNGMALNIRGAMGGNSNTDGGALVPEEFNQTIIDLREQYGIFRQQCQVVPMGRDVMLIPRRLGGITIGAIGENPSIAISQSNPTFNQVTLNAKKCGGLTLVSTEVAEDAVIDLAEWVAQEFAYGFANFEDTAGFTGDGTSTYLGIRGLTNLLTTASGLKGAVAAASTHDTFAEIDNTDLTTCMSALPQYARRNAKWYCSTVAADVIFHRLQAVAGGNNVQTLQGGTGDSYLGYPIVISQVLPTSTSTINGTAMLFFGDLRMAATMGDRRQVRVMTSNERYFDTDQIGIKGIERIDIVVHDIGTTSVGGPIVGLMGTT